MPTTGPEYSGNWNGNLREFEKQGFSGRERRSRVRRRARRVAAKECSPGREPRCTSQDVRSPERAKEPYSAGPGLDFALGRLRPGPTRSGALLMGQTIVEKIAQAHLAEGPKRPLRTGDFVAIRPHRVMTHDNTSAVIKKFQTIGAKKIENPKQLVFALDHDIQNKEDSNLHKYQAIEGFAKHHGVDFYPAGSGIGHQIMVERGYVLPGSFVVASDSHSNMYGALGAVGTPIVRTDAAAAWATGDFWWQIPRSIQVVLEGSLPAGATGKDVIITLCGLYNHDEVLNSAVEFSGPGVASLSMDARFSISNMSTEWGPLVGWFPVDDVTIKYLQAVKQRLALQGIERFADRDITNWSENPPQPDPDAVYAARIVLDLSQVTPHVSGPDTVRIMASLANIETQKTPIQKAYLLSCVG